MRICPKCRNFYADETLKFCPADGVPLIGVDPSGKLWPEGTEAVRKTASRVQREIRRQKLKKILSMTVTTVLVIMVVSVVTLNSYIYLNPEEKEIAQATPTPVVETVSETPTPGAEETPSPTPDATSSPVTSPTLTRTPTPVVCSAEERSINTAAIIDKNIEAWKKEIWSREESTRRQRFIAVEVQHNIPFQKIEVELIITRPNINVNLSEDCKQARARVSYAWHFTAWQYRELPPPKPKKAPTPVLKTDGANRATGDNRANRDIGISNYPKFNELVSRSYPGVLEVQCTNNGGNWVCR